MMRYGEDYEHHWQQAMRLPPVGPDLASARTSPAAGPVPPPATSTTAPRVSQLDSSLQASATLFQMPASVLSEAPAYSPSSPIPSPTPPLPPATPVTTREISVRSSPRRQPTAISIAARAATARASTAPSPESPPWQELQRELVAGLTPVQRARSLRSTAHENSPESSARESSSESSAQSLPVTPPRPKGPPPQTSFASALRATSTRSPQCSPEHSLESTGSIERSSADSPLPPSAQRPVEQWLDFDAFASSRDRRHARRARAAAAPSPAISSANPPAAAPSPPPLMARSSAAITIATAARGSAARGRLASLRADSARRHQAATAIATAVRGISACDRLISLRRVAATTAADTQQSTHDAAHRALVCALQDEHFAHDLQPPAESCSWPEAALAVWFESGGITTPTATVPTASAGSGLSAQPCRHHDGHRCPSLRCT